MHTANLASSGFGPVNYLEMLKEFGVKYQPDLILLNYFVGNDLMDTHFTLNRTNPPPQHLKALLKQCYLGRYLLEVRARLYQQKRIKTAQRDMEKTLPADARPLNPFVNELVREYGGVKKGLRAQGMLNP